PAGIEADDHVIQASQPPLALGDQARSEGPAPVPGDVQLDRPDLGLDGLRGGPVAGVVMLRRIRACQMVCVSRTERNGTIMTMTNEKQQHDDGPSGQDLVEQLKASGQLDALFEQIDAGPVDLTGDGGFEPHLAKPPLHQALQAQLTSTLANAM